MLTKQEQEILDNAPEGAEYYVTDLDLGGYYKDITNNGYMFHDGKTWLNGVGDCALLYLPLADLRKKQGKTVVDAVVSHKGVWPHPHHESASFSNDEWTFFFRGIDEHHVCTIEEFNQCVKEMSEIATANELMHYRANNSPLEPLKEYKMSKEKPRMKVEYVKVVEANCCVWDLKGMLERELLYTLHGDGKYLLCSNNAPMHMLICFDEGRVYRKVETEITWKDEIRSHIKACMYLGFDDSLSETLHKSISAQDFSYDKEFIEMCHLVSSMNK